MQCGDVLQRAWRLQLVLSSSDPLEEQGVGDGSEGEVQTLRSRRCLGFTVQEGSQAPGKGKVKHSGREQEDPWLSPGSLGQPSATGL